MNQAVGSVSVPVAWVTLFNIISMLIFVKMSEKVIVPCLRRNGRTFSTTWRISLGMICTCISMMLGRKFILDMQKGKTLMKTCINNLAAASEIIYKLRGALRNIP